MIFQKSVEVVGVGLIIPSLITYDRYSRGMGGVKKHRFLLASTRTLITREADGIKKHRL